MPLADELERIEGHAQALAGDGDRVSGILAAEPSDGIRVYVCSFDGADGLRSWLAVYEDGTPVTARADLRAAVSIAAMCELAADVAGGGDLDDVLARLADLRLREGPEGIEDAEAAARALRDVIGEPPQLASPSRLDAIGAAARRLEQELGSSSASPFLATMRAADGVVGELQREIEAGYRVALTQRRASGSYNGPRWKAEAASSRSAEAIPRSSSGRSATSPSARPSRSRRRNVSSSRR